MDINYLKLKNGLIMFHRKIYKYKNIYKYEIYKCDISVRTEETNVIIFMYYTFNNMLQSFL